MRLQFLGGTETVTGSKYLVEHDHSGYIPRLVEQGFRGKVFATAATLELCRLLLPDSGHLQEEEEEARYANRHGFSKHAPALPLYTEVAAQRALRQFQVCSFDRPFEPVPGLKARFSRAGHLLGAAGVDLSSPSASILFSGDLGRSDDLVMKPPMTTPVRAEVVDLAGLSAHADREDLLAWVAALPRAPRQVCVTHGEPEAADALRQATEERHCRPCCVPEYLRTIEV